MNGPAMAGPPEPTIVYTARANQYDMVGPMATATGDVVMVQIAPVPVGNPAIDPIQVFLEAGQPLDASGGLAADGVLLPSRTEYPFLGVILPTDAPTMRELNIRREELMRTNFFKTVSKSEITTRAGRAMPDDVMAGQAFTLTGTTLTGAGLALGGCAVTVEQTGLQYVGGQPIIAETVSDGSGNFSIPVRNIDYQVTAYLAGSPDKAGITKNNVTPINSVSIYLRDPTAADSGGSGAGMSRSRVANA